jgi:hypothetical protein
MYSHLFLLLTLSPPLIIFSSHLPPSSLLSSFSAFSSSCVFARVVTKGNIQFLSYSRLTGKCLRFLKMTTFLDVTNVSKDIVASISSVEECSSTVKIDARHSSEALIHIYQNTRRPSHGKALFLFTTFKISDLTRIIKFSITDFMLGI